MLIKITKPGSFLKPTCLDGSATTSNQEEDVDIIVHHIHGVIESFLKRQLHEKSSGPPEQKREEFKALVSDAAKPFVLGRTERFSDELELFLVSGLTIDAYDKVYAESMSIKFLKATC